MKKFKITSFHYVYVTDFNNGELDYVNSYTLESVIEAERLKDAIQEYFNNFLDYYFTFGNAVIDTESNRIYYDVLVDEDNIEIEDVETKEHWKNGEITLYNNNISVLVEEITEVSLEGLI